MTEHVNDMPPEPALNFRQSDEIDYANFPANASYISRADVRSAYDQGRKDADKDRKTAIAEKDAEIAQLRARIENLQEHSTEQAWDKFLRIGQ